LFLDSQHLRLFHKVVLDVWDGKQANAVALIRGLEKQVNELKGRKEKLRNAFVYQQTMDRKDYEEMRAALNEELAPAELNLGQARVDEVEVEKVLDFCREPAPQHGRNVAAMFIGAKATLAAGAFSSGRGICGLHLSNSGNEPHFQRLRGTHQSRRGRW
jgi:hypothetical protein